MGRSLSRPSAGRIGVAFVVGSLLGLGALAPAWSAPAAALPDGEFGAVVGLAVLGLLAFTAALWLAVTVLILG